MMSLTAILIYCLGANSKWIGVRELPVRVFGLPVSAFRNARLYECFGTEEAVFLDLSREAMANKNLGCKSQVTC